MARRTAGGWTEAASHGEETSRHCQRRDAGLVRLVEPNAGFIGKPLARNPGKRCFRYSRPNGRGDEVAGLDIDPVRVASSVLRSRFFDSRGFAGHAAGSTHAEGWASALMSRLLPCMASAGLVAQKPR